MDNLVPLKGGFEGIYKQEVDYEKTPKGSDVISEQSLENLGIFLLLDSHMIPNKRKIHELT
jgi:hypothetical protein